MIVIKQEGIPTPPEEFLDRKPKIKLLRVFGIHQIYQKRNTSISILKGKRSLLLATKVNRKIIDFATKQNSHKQRCGFQRKKQINQEQIEENFYSYALKFGLAEECDA